MHLSIIGLLRRLALLDPIAFNEGNRLYTELKGALTENFVLQSIVSQYEVDFIIQHGNDIIPVEVKADQNINGRSLTLYGQKYASETKIQIRCSLRNLKLDGNLLNIPFFMMDYMDQLIAIALPHDNI